MTNDDLKTWEPGKEKEEHHEHHTHEHHETNHEHHNVEHKHKSGWNAWKITTVLLIVALAFSIYTKGFSEIGFGIGNASDIAADNGFSFVVLNDVRCKECDTAGLVTQLKQIFPNATVKEYDYSTKEGAALYDKLELAALPAVLFTESVKTQAGYPNVQNYLEQKGDFLSLKIGATFDPKGEICDNEVDDNDNGQIDCDDESCKTEWKCMPKLAQPKVELFVMSHCPYGTQIEKGIIPAVETLGTDVDFTLKFCDYAMHGEKELQEQLTQYCIQKEQKSLFIDYLKCFLEAGDSASCITKAKVDKTKLDKCIDTADEQYKVTENFNDQSTYKGSFPTFTIFQSDVDKYGVQGSPTLVINGVTAQSGRDSASLLDAICTGFDEKPDACDEELSSASPTPGFGYGTQAAGAATADAGCGA